jgi:hypothetical protein
VKGTVWPLTTFLLGPGIEHDSCTRNRETCQDRFRNMLPAYYPSPVASRFQTDAVLWGFLSTLLKGQALRGVHTTAETILPVETANGWPRKPIRGTWSGKPSSAGRGHAYSPGQQCACSHGQELQLHEGPASQTPTRVARRHQAKHPPPLSRASQLMTPMGPFTYCRRCSTLLHYSRPNPIVVICVIGAFVWLEDS